VREDAPGAIISGEDIDLPAQHLATQVGGSMFGLAFRQSANFTELWESSRADPARRRWLWPALVPERAVSAAARGIFRGALCLVHLHAAIFLKLARVGKRILRLALDAASPPVPRTCRRGMSGGSPPPAGLYCTWSEENF